MEPSNILGGNVMKVKSCPKCGAGRKKIILCNIRSNRLPWWWFVQCDSCHYCGKTKLFLFRAILSWNRNRHSRF